MAEHTALLSILVEEIAEDTLMERIQSNISVASDSIHVGSSAALSLVRDMIRDPVRVEGYVPDVVNHYSDIEFKSHFRMKRSTFEANIMLQQLCTDVAPYMRRERTMKLETKMLATLWMLGNLECYRSVADRFGISKGTLHLTVISTCKAISSLKTDYIKFPENRTEMDAIAEGFHKRCGMPGVVGAIDGTHIPVPAPTSEHRASFINRKGFSSIQLQVVCDSNLKLLDTYTGWPGSVHDARVYRNSPISEVIERLGENYHVLGDSAYPLTASMLVPYRDNGHLDPVQKKFNKVHSSTRVDVERAIGLLKCKFRRLKSLDMHLQEEIPEVITACCVVHNVILDCEMVEEDITLDDAVDNSASDQDSQTRQASSHGETKRRRIANML